MIKKNAINITISCIFLLYIVLYRVLIYPKFMGYAEAMSASFILLVSGISFLLYGFRKYSNTTISKKHIKCVLYYVIVYFIFTYGIGLVCGFLNNSYSLKPLSILNNVFMPIIIIICSEIFRYNFVKNNKDNLVFISIISILLFLFDINFYIKDSTFSALDIGFEFVTTMFIPKMIESFMFSYFCYHGDYKASILYRFVMELYVYILPIQPDLNPLIASIASILLPFAILFSLYNQTTDDYKKAVKKRLISPADIPFAIAVIVFICVVYGIGPYKMLGIETGSMQPNFNIGDAVVIDKNYDPEKLKVGDVIAYEDNDNKIIIHRIVKINSDKTFITKGDNNNVADSFYVHKEKIKGCVRVKVPYIAYPALLFK